MVHVFFQERAVLYFARISFVLGCLLEEAGSGHSSRVVCDLEHFSLAVVAGFFNLASTVVQASFGISRPVEKPLRGETILISTHLVTRSRNDLSLGFKFFFKLLLNPTSAEIGHTDIDHSPGEFLFHFEARLLCTVGVTGCILSVVFRDLVGQVGAVKLSHVIVLLFL
jgi:hypothetical protein